MTAQNIKLQKGFTLIELLVVIGILAILLAITLIAINPARQFGQANDTKRRSSVTQILNAVGAYTADAGKGVVPNIIPTTATEIGKTGVVPETKVDLCSILVTDYIPALPVDPSLPGSDQIALTGTPPACPATYTTGYFIKQDATGRVTVSTTGSDGNPIEVTR